MIKNKLFWAILATIIVTNLAVIFNIPVIQQVFAFVFLTIIPGFLILSILRLHKLGLLEKIILSVALSLFFVTTFGFVINEAYFALGYSSPLSTISLLPSFTVAVLALLVVAYLRNREAFSVDKKSFALSTKEKIFIIVPMAFPILGLLGGRAMDMNGDNTISMLLFGLIALYVCLITFLHKKVPPRFYPIIIFLIAISIMLMYRFQSPYILARDGHQEYYLFQLTFNNQHWMVFDVRSNVNSCLFSTLLPSVYQSLTSIGGQYVVKILESVTFPVTMIAVYVLARSHIKEPYAFLAAFYFVIPRVMGPMFTGRMSYVFMFFAVTMMVVFHDNVGPVAKKVLILIFIWCLITSHYGTAMLFLICLIIGYLLLQIVRRWRKTVHVLLVPTTLALVIVLGYAWYNYVVQAVFISVITFGEYSVNSLRDIFVPRESTIQRVELFGSSLPSGIAYQTELYLHWIGFLLIALGLFTVMMRWRQTLQIQDKESPVRHNGEAGFLVKRFRIEHFVLMVTFCIVLVGVVIVPYASRGYSWTRAYTPMLIILAPLLVIGCVNLSRFIKVKPHLLAVLILIPTFLFASGMVYQFLGTPKSLALSTQSQDYNIAYTHPQDARAAQWIGKSMTSSEVVFADLGGRELLNSQGLLSRFQHTSLYQMYSRYSRWGEPREGYVFLRYYNIVHGYAIDVYMRDMNELSWYSGVLDTADRIYNNGSAQILLIHE